ncbi:apolipoprotein N-acyltransferase [Sanguibacter suarezii]|uniref:apolipoprotein N-acyltransferase n=1 Tax=Sanguibacter suarezii TaxID=60921 RepID=UPI001FDF2A76|nr:apolipoprotein N-acyltransferase [Sanguibacter suarezii]
MLVRLPRWLTLVLAVAGGLLADAGFPDIGIWLATLAGVALLFIATVRDSPAWNFFVGTVWGLSFFLVHIRWAQYAVGDVPWVALSAAEALFVGASMLAWTYVRRIAVVGRHASLQALTFALVFVAGELARSAVPFGGFPWGRVAFSQSESPIGRLAWLGGMPLVSLVAVVAAALLAIAVLALGRLNLFRAGGCALAAAAAVGVGLVVPLATQAESGTLQVGAVQGNVATPGLDAFNHRREVLNNHVTGTYALLDEVAQGDLDIVLWPENGTDIDPQVDADAATLIDDAAAAVGAPILVGSQEFPPSGGRYNVSLLWEPGVGVVDRYAKQHPAPFAEYIPIRDLVRPFSSAVDLVTNDMIAGTEVGIIELDSPRLGRMVTIGDVICFEVAYDALVQQSVAAGAEMLVVPTNNASFGPTNESTQQLAMSRLRAIETGRTTIQISTVGVSAVIAPNGVLLDRTGLFTAEQMISSVALRTSLTPAVRAGEWPARVVLVAAGALTLAGMITSLRDRRAARAVPPVTRRAKAAPRSAPARRG